MTLSQFEDIRSYNDDEIPEAMEYMLNDESSLNMFRFIVPDATHEDLKNLIGNIKTVDEFQRKVMTRFVNWIISNTIQHLDCQGFENIKKENAYLFTANHRDITLDAFVLQMCMLNNNLDTCNIAFGSNLIMSDLINVFSKTNKMFKVERSKNFREFAYNSQHLSDYIRYLIRDRKSVWIAQRDGRTKDGNDKTDHGLITMFSLSGDRKDMVSNLAELNITPVSTSYEYEPCAMLKARESYIKERVFIPRILLKIWTASSPAL